MSWDLDYSNMTTKLQSCMYECKKPHPSIVTSLEKVQNCLDKSSHLECFLCPPKKYKPTFTSKVKSHLVSHGESGSGVRLFPDCLVLTCHLLACKQLMSKQYPANQDSGKKGQTKKDGHGHYHCPDCGNILARKSNFRSHMESQHNYRLPDPVMSKQKKTSTKRKVDDSETKISVEETCSPGLAEDGRSAGPTEEMGSPGLAQDMEHLTVHVGLTDEVHLRGLNEVTDLNHTKDTGFHHISGKTGLDSLHNSNPFLSQPSLDDIEMSCSLQTAEVLHPSMNNVEMSCTDEVSHPPVNDIEMSFSTQPTDKDDTYCHEKSHFGRSHEINANTLQIQEVEVDGQTDSPTKKRKFSDGIDLQQASWNFDKDMAYDSDEPDTPVTDPSNPMLSGYDNDDLTFSTDSPNKSLIDKPIDISGLLRYLNDDNISWEELEKGNAVPSSLPTQDSGYYEVEMQEVPYV